MALPRQAEFETNSRSADRNIAGAGFWAYGGPTYPSGTWAGWHAYVQSLQSPRDLHTLDEEYYYDATWVMHNFTEYFNDPQWAIVAHDAFKYYAFYVQNAAGNSGPLFAETPPKTAFPAHRAFPEGCLREYQRNTGDPAQQALARKVIHALAWNSAAFGAFTPLQFLGSDDASPNVFTAREVGYNLLSKWIAEEQGYSAAYGFPPLQLVSGVNSWEWEPNPAIRWVKLADIGKLYLDQWLNLLNGGDGGINGPEWGGNGQPMAPKYRYCRPFMVANVIEGLRKEYEHTGDATIITKTTAVLNKLWDVCYSANGITMPATVPGGGPSPQPGYQYGTNSFTYTDRMTTADPFANNGDIFGSSPIPPDVWVANGSSWKVPATSALWPTPELNGLIIPVYWWMYRLTGTQIWKDRCDLLFNGMITVTYNGVLQGGDGSQQAWNLGKLFNQMWARSFEYIHDSTGGIIIEPPPPPTPTTTIPVNERLITKLTNQYMAVPLIEDAAIRKADPTSQYGSLDHPLSVAKFDAGNHEHSLIRFTGLNTIPVGSVVTKVILGLWGQFNTGTSAYLIDVRRCLRPWVEATVDWNEYATGQAWGTAGCLSDGVDRVATASVQLSAPGGGDAWLLTTQTTGGLITDVQAWVNGTVVNNGWHFERNGSGADGQWRAFANSQNPDHTINPYLLVYFTAASVLRPEETASLLARGASAMISLDAGAAL